MRPSNNKNPVLRRVINLPYTVRNICRLFWHFIRDVLKLLLFQMKIIFRLLAKSFGFRFGSMSKQDEQTYQKSEKNILVLMLCIPVAILFGFKDRKIIKRIFFPFLPKLGDFFQHEPREWRHKVAINNEFENSDSLKLAIVTPSYNQAAFVKRTIDSVMDQDYSKLQYVVQDGASDDGTVAILKSHESDFVWQSVADLGQTDGLNKAVEKLKDWDIMSYLNSDDLLLPNTISIVVDFFIKNPDVDVVYGNRLMIDENDLCIGEWVLHGHSSHVLSFVDYIPQETLFWRKEIWEKVGGSFDDSFRFAMDWDLLLRFRNAGATFAHIPEFLGAFRIHKAQKTQAIINEVGDKEMDRIRERELGYLPDYVEIFGTALPYLVRHTWADFKYRYLS